MARSRLARTSAVMRSSDATLGAPPVEASRYGPIMVLWSDRKWHTCVDLPTYTHPRDGVSMGSIHRGWKDRARAAEAITS